MDKVNILLVDDQPGKLLTYQAILDELGENLVTANSGREALQHLLKQEFALVLLDVVMPDMDGFETATMIRQRPRLELTPIIFVTAYSTTDLDRMKGYELGAVDYVFSPIVPEILRAKTLAFVELYRKRRELAQANTQLLEEIAERKRAQEQLRESEERFRLMLENVKDYAILMLNPEGNVVTWNVGAERLVGYKTDEIIGEYFACFYSRDDAERGKPEVELRRATDEGRYEDEGWRFRKDGSRFWANVTITALHGPNHELIGFAMISRDLTERKRAEERALQAERLAAIGQMVTGLAHESRNALQHIQASIEMLARRIQSGPEAGLIAGMQKAHDRLHHLLEEVRSYAAPINLDRRECDLPSLWREAWSELAPLREGRVTIFREDMGDLDMLCFIDPFPIERVFRNILENAITACADPVQIEVHCAAAKIDGRPAFRVRMQDNGPGLSVEQRQRIFEPFFTTKTRGTGLGMAIAKRIVEAHGGQIAVGDAPESGTVIEMLLPRGSP